jgi:N-acetylneuraminic acid mutarotase
MIVWGGATGGRYNPSTDSWTATSIAHAPVARFSYPAVWSGTEMIIWGGFDGGSYFNTGGRYNPGTNSWTATTVANAPIARFSHTAVWTGSEMIVWGGFGSNLAVLNTGGRYNPRTDTWTATSTTNAPTARELHTAIWTGSDMIVWSGYTNTNPAWVNTGGRYNPSTDTWVATNTTNAPGSRDYHTAVWTGSEMIVWGGLGGLFHNPLNTGGKYNPRTDTWIATSTTNAPTGRRLHTAVWTGSEMIVWGGQGLDAVNTGGRYNPNMNSWTATTLANAPNARFSHTAVWTGREMIVWGGNDGISGFNTGGRYCAPFPGSQLGNISTRALVQTGDNVMIGGFIVQGSQTKRVIIRAIGPELTRFGVPNPLFNPTLELHDGTGALIASNDNWMTTIIGGIITSNQFVEIRDSGHAPGDGRESAIIADLAPGNYTAIVRGVDNMTGVALAEVYDLSADASSILGNISTRSFVQTGDNAMIGGFIVQGTQPKRVIIRGIGPELTQHGVPNPLGDPTLELHNGTGVLIASNDNWQTTIIGGIIIRNQVQAIMLSGHAPAQPSESAIIADLPPGNYTAIVRGVNNTTGVALVEVYDFD